MSSRAAVGGGYGALVKKSKNADRNKSADNQPKTKSAKVMSLKDTNEKKPAPHKEVKEAKKQDQPKKTVEKEKDRDLTKRELKGERTANDRHQPRSGYADHSKTPKNEQVAEALDAEKGDSRERTEADEKRQQEADEREAERKRKEEEEKRQMTYAEYQKSLKEKKEGLVSQKNARKVDAKGFAKMQEMNKKDDDEFFRIEKKVVETKPAKPAAKKSGKEVKAAPKPATKKGKFTKSSDVQLGFFTAKNDRPQGKGGYKGDRRRDQPNRGDAAPKEEEKPEQTEAPAATTEEAAPAQEEGTW